MLNITLVLYSSMKIWRHLPEGVFSRAQWFFDI